MHLDIGWRALDGGPSPTGADTNPQAQGGEHSLQRLLDREAIRELMVRYTWSIYRMDAQLLRSVYWPDADEDHGDYVGKIEGFIDWLMPRLRERARTTILLTAVDMDFDGSTARAHSLGQIHIRKSAGAGCWQDIIAGSRYQDVIEQRQGEWRILKRKATLDWLRDLGPTGAAS